MSAKLLYRIAAVIFLLFAAGHTMGFTGFEPPTAEAAAVRAGMSNVHFAIGSSSCTFWGFYLGFGLHVTVYLLFSAVLAWRLSTRPDALLGWTLCAVQVAGLVLSLMYFFIVPTVFSAVLAVALGVAASRT